MRAFLLKSAAIGGCLLLAASAFGAAAKPPAKAARSDCFSSRQISNFSASSERTVYVRVGTRAVYKLEMFGSCQNIDNSLGVGVRMRGGGIGGGFICHASDFDLVVRGYSGRPERCPVRSMTRLTPAEVEALKPRDRP